MPTPSAPHPIPHLRLWSVLARTVHILAISILVGGHAFGALAEQLRPMLYVTIASGLIMAFLEAYPSCKSLFQGWGILLMIKLALLCAVPLAWNHRFAILVAVLIIGSVGSHMTKRLRHYSLLYGPEPDR